MGGKVPTQQSGQGLVLFALEKYKREQKEYVEGVAKKKKKKSDSVVWVGLVKNLGFLSFLKTFDTVPHSTLVDKLSSCEVSRVSRYTVC